MITITPHARRRIVQRVDHRRHMIREHAVQAFSRGLAHGQLTGKLRKYIIKEYRRKGTANNIRVYNGFIWIFCGVELVTVWRQPTFAVNRKRHEIKKLRQQNKLVCQRWRKAA